MAEHDKGTASVDRLADATDGSVVWVFDANQSVHADGKYVGRGLWRLRPIGSSTRASFIVDGTKYDRETGSERARGGFSSGNKLFGEIEKIDQQWVSKHRYALIRHLEYSKPEVLRKVADLIGWSPDKQERD